MRKSKYTREQIEALDFVIEWAYANTRDAANGTALLDDATKILKDIIK